MNHEQLSAFLGKEWDSSIVPALSEYIRIPNQSPNFDKDWATNGSRAHLLRCPRG